MQQIRFEFEGSNMPNPHTASFEPTEALPNGLTPDMELGVSVVDEDRVQVSFNEGNDELLDMTAVAGEMINQEAGNPSQRAQIRSFQVKKTRLLTMTVYFGPGAKGEIEYPAEVISSGAKVDRIDKLPAAILKQIDNEKAELLRPKKSGQ